MQKTAFEIRISDWISDVCSSDLRYGENTPPAGRWLVDGRPVRPQDWRKPALVVLPERDRLVPKEGAEAILSQLPQADRLDVPSGHIGMMVGPRAESGLWRPLADWLLRPAAAGPQAEQGGQKAAGRRPQRKRTEERTGGNKWGRTGRTRGGPE